MNTQKLKGLLVEKGKTYEECAKALNMSITSFSNKMNDKTRFDIVEINKLVNYLELNKEEATNIFLSSNLHNMQDWARLRAEGGLYE